MPSHRCAFGARGLGGIIRVRVREVEVERLIDLPRLTQPSTKSSCMAPTQWQPISKKDWDRLWGGGVGAEMVLNRCGLVHPHTRHPFGPCNETP